jgi:hypothetical protein
MRAEVSITDEEIQILLIPEGLIDKSILDEVSKADTVSQSIPISRTERGVAISKNRSVKQYITNKPSYGEPAARR